MGECGRKEAETSANTSGFCIPVFWSCAADLNVNGLCERVGGAAVCSYEHAGGWRDRLGPWGLRSRSPGC